MRATDSSLSSFTLVEGTLDHLTIAFVREPILIVEKSSTIAEIRWGCDELSRSDGTLVVGFQAGGAIVSLFLHVYDS